MGHSGEWMWLVGDVVCRCKWSFFFLFSFFFPAVDCGDGWMWLVGLLFVVVSGDFFFFFFPYCDLWWWVDVASGDDGVFLLVVA